MRHLLALLLALPLFAQLPSGVTRTPYPDDGPQRDPQYMVVTADGTLWATQMTEGVLDRIESGGGAKRFDLPYWGGTRGLTVGPDGALWMAARHYIGRHDPATHALKQFTAYRGVTRILSGPDGNVWFVQVPEYTNSLTEPRIVRFRTDGVVLDTFQAGGNVVGAVFGSDGALWLTTRNASMHRLVRLTTTGTRTEYPIGNAGALFAGPGFLWTRVDGNIVRVNLQGEITGTFKVAMTPMTVDAIGNLWLRATTEDGFEIAQLTPHGVLTRFVPLPALPSDACIGSAYGGMVVLHDGRVAMADYYPLIGWRPEDPCATMRHDFARTNTLTILDPALAPVRSIEQLNPVPRRRVIRR